MSAHIKDYGPPLIAGIWLTVALVQPTFYHIASGATVALLSLQVWLEWHKEAFK